MGEVRSLIAALHDINRSDGKTVAHFLPSLIGMFGSLGIFDAFLSEMDAALVSGSLSTSLGKRASNLSGTFIPQIADYNGIKDPAAIKVTAETIRNISADTLEGRKEGVSAILGALMAILKEVNALK